MGLVWDVGEVCFRSFPHLVHSSFFFGFLLHFPFSFCVDQHLRQVFIKMDTVKFEKKSSETFKNPGQPAFVSASDQGSRYFSLID